MPIIEYECHSCRRNFIRTMEQDANEAPKCPYCGRQWSVTAKEEVK